MPDEVVVLGAGYAGTGAVKRAQAEIGDEADLTWISERDYHLVLHEVHRVIRDPDVADAICLSVEEVADPGTRFVEGHVDRVDTDERVVGLADGTEIGYDYLLAALGSQTAFYGIDGLREHALTLNSLEDALAIRDAVLEAGVEATRNDPAQVLVGGAGLSGIQTAGEIAELGEKRRMPLDIRLVEGLDNVFPGNPPSVQRALRERLEQRGIEITTGEFVSNVGERMVSLGGGEDEAATQLPWDVLVWTGGITGREELAGADVDADDRSHRIHAESNLRTSNERVFAIGDTALVEQGPESVAPPTAQAAWQAADVAGRNLAHAVRGDPLETWTHRDKGTVVSVGEDAVAHGVAGIPIETFGGPGARFLKKTIAARWIADVGSVRRAMGAWRHM